MPKAAKSIDVHEPTKREWVTLSAQPENFDPSNDAGVKFFVRVPAEWLKAATNPKNWRQHPTRQRRAYNALKEKTGLADTIKFNRITQVLFDGHMRLHEAVKAKEMILVQVGDWSEEQENYLLAGFDPIGAMAKADPEALRNLTKATKKTLSRLQGSGQTKLELSKIGDDLEAHVDAVESGETSSVMLGRSRKKPKPEPEEEEDAADEQADEHTEDQEPDNSLADGYVPPSGASEVSYEVRNNNALFESSNSVGIPDLLVEGLAEADLAPTRTFLREKDVNYGPETYFCWSTRPWDSYPRDGGCLGWYCEDWRFETVFNDYSKEYSSADLFVDKLLGYDFTSVLTPDYSTYHALPLVVQLFNVYRSRWCGRYWQEHGIPVIPSIQSIGVLGNEKESRELMSTYVYGTLPVDYVTVVAIQTRKERKFSGKNSHAVRLLTQTLEELPALEKLVVYGGREIQKYLHGHVPSDTNCEIIYLPSFTAERRKHK